MENKYGARIIINNTNNDGEYTRDFLILMWEMGAELTINYGGEDHLIDTRADYRAFFNATKPGKNTIRERKMDELKVSEINIKHLEALLHAQVDCDCCKCKIEQWCSCPFNNRKTHTGCYNLHIQYLTEK